jgi:ABC-type cobalamin/Fe3+-siderophores transport system ATPase subunit
MKLFVDIPFCRVSSRFSLRNVRFELNPGEIGVLVGGNGSGKTQLLRVVSGITSVESADIRYGERAIESLSIADLTKLRSIAFQSFAIPYGLSVSQYLAVVDDDFEKRADILDALEIKYLLHDQLTNISGGELARVNLAQCLLQDTPIVMLDETDSPMDSKRKSRYVTLLREFSKTVLLISHEQAVIQQADVRIQLDAGRQVDR